MFGNLAARRRRSASQRVQNWVDEGMEMVRDRAKQPAMWGAALSVAVCALMGYTAYKNREEIVGTTKVVSARAQRALRREMRSKSRAAARGKKKAAASKTHA